VFGVTPCNVDSKVGAVITEGHVIHQRRRTELAPNHSGGEVSEDR
jgi:hypothetical protein